MPEGEGRARRSSAPVRVWSEFGVTVDVGDHNYVKVSHGEEAWARNDSTAAVLTAERRIHERCIKIVEERVDEITRLVQAVREEGDKATQQKQQRRRRGSS